MKPQIKEEEFWDVDADGELLPSTAKIKPSYREAHDIMHSDARIDDVRLAHAAALAAEEARNDVDVKLDRQLSNLEGLQQRAETNDSPGLTDAIRFVETGVANLVKARDKEVFTNRKVVGAVEQVLIDRRREALERRVDDRIKADALPWTMPHSKLTDKEMTGIRNWHEQITGCGPEPQPDDVFSIPSARRSEGERFARADEALLREAKVDSRSPTFTRAELQRAGVFFINRVGDGEQPIFGIPIPDDESADGMFNVQDRTFLTRDEFVKVYDYQQAHGYGLGGLGTADVQTDMVAYGVRPESRNTGLIRRGGAGRENKYSQMRSPFVTSGFYVRDDLFGTIEVDTTGKYFEGTESRQVRARRMNTLTVHLVNAHPDYPGVSEMQDPAKSDWDQHYMTPAEFVRHLYQPPPDMAEAFYAIKDGVPTKRERMWVGELQE